MKSEVPNKWGYITILTNIKGIGNETMCVEYQYISKMVKNLNSKRYKDERNLKYYLDYSQSGMSNNCTYLLLQTFLHVLAAFQRSPSDPLEAAPLYIIQIRYLLIAGAHLLPTTPPLMETLPLWLQHSCGPLGVPEGYAPALAVPSNVTCVMS